MYLPRLLEKNIKSMLEQNKSVLLLGPRQTGKTTLTTQLQASKRFTLANPRDRLRYEKEPFALSAEVEALATQIDDLPLVIIDEIQKIPILTDAVQDLIDRKIAKFVLTGSSVRKLRRNEDMNLLPGRVIPMRLDPLTLEEIPNTHRILENLLLDGTLPEILLEKNASIKTLLLEAYVTTYLEEEIRSEALVRHLGQFARFLEFAASASGKIINFSKLSQEIGVTHQTIANYYQILEDCLIIIRIEPFSTSRTRRKLTKMPKYLFYDLGVRRVAAREGRHLPQEHMGHLFEHYIGLELTRLLHLRQSREQLRYWRDSNGPEVDWVIEGTDHLIPIEVKWTELPTLQDAKHLQVFLNEYKKARKAYIVCRTPHPMQLDSRIIALPWQELSTLI